MLTWQQFYEAKESKDVEKEEEKLGKDLDDDDEEGESAEHKAKVFGKKEKEEKDLDDEEGESAEHKAKVLGFCKKCKASKKKCKC